VIATGSSSATFAVNSKAVKTTANGTITAKLGGVTQTVAISVVPAFLGSVTLSPATVVGGSKTVVTGTVSLDGLTTAAITVKLKSSNTKAATVPGSVRILAGKGSATFTVNHLRVTSSESVTITLRIDPRMLARIKRLARMRYLNYQSMIKQWLSERMEHELREK
jgi:Flp pilus assembly protein TadG